MMMMKPNNGQLQSPPGQKMSVYMRACPPLLCEGERTAVWLRGGKKKTQNTTKKLVLQDAEIGEICKHGRATTGGPHQEELVHEQRVL